MPLAFPAAVVREWGKLEVADVPAFPAGPYDAVCRIEACSICAATDTHLVEGSFPAAWCSPPPFVLGHESAGHVAAVGAKVRNFKVGQLVVRPLWLPDAPRFGELGSAWGGFASWGIVRDTHALAEDTGRPTDYFWRSSQTLPEMPVRDATLFVTWRDTLSCLLQLGVKPGDRLVVFGSGGNGLSFVRCAALLGAKAVMVGSPSRESRALRLGALAFVDYHLNERVPPAVRESFSGNGASLVIEAVGDARPLPQMLACLDHDGALFLFGIPGDLKYAGDLMAGPAQYRIVKKTCEEWQSHELVLRHYLNGELDPNDFCDATMPLSRIQEAFALVRRREASKITLLMPHD